MQTRKEIIKWLVSTRKLRNNLIKELETLTVYNTIYIEERMRQIVRYNTMISAWEDVIRVEHNSSKT